MHLHVEVSVAGWWAGVLHPMQAPALLITVLLVGLLGGLAVRVGRSSWTLPTAFVGGLAVFGLIGLVLNHPLDVDPIVFALSVVLAALLFVHPRRIGAIAPVIALTSGALCGLGHSVDGSGAARQLGYIAGFVFTSVVLLTVGDIVGAAVGRSLRGRLGAVAGARRADMDDHVLV